VSVCSRIRGGFAAQALTLCNTVIIGLAASLIVIVIVSFFEKRMTDRQKVGHGNCRDPSARLERTAG
jgi:hypothetical protein